MYAKRYKKYLITYFSIIVWCLSLSQATQLNSEVNKVNGKQEYNEEVVWLSDKQIEDEESLKPKDQNKMTLDEVVNLIDSSVFTYDGGQKKGKYLAVIKEVDKKYIQNSPYSHSFMSFICNELKCYYLSVGEKTLGNEAFELFKEYDKESNNE